MLHVKLKIRKLFQVQSNDMIDLTGKIFKTITVLEKTNKIAKNKTNIWICQCNLCNKKLNLSTTTITKSKNFCCNKRPIYSARLNPNKENESTLNNYRVDFGYTWNQLALKLGCKSLTELIGYSNGTVSPISKTGKIKKLIINLADFFNVTPADLFPRYFCKLDHKEFSEEQLIDLLIGNYTKIISNPKTKMTVKELVETLPLKEKNIIFKRYWKDKSFKELGKELNMSKQRVHQIELSILNKLKRRLKYI